VIYAIAAWASLFIINGILSWQLTPGRWLETHRVADGFFNPSFWPSLLFRTVVSTTLAALAACVVVNTMSRLDREARRSLINRAAHLMLPMVLMPVLGVWFLMAMPPDSRSWVTGGSPAMTMFMFMSIIASLAIGAYALIGLWLQRLYINGATATLLLLLAFFATAGGEFVREGSRKPYTIRYVLYSNGIRPDEVAHLREVGSLLGDPFPLRNMEGYPNPQVEEGARVFRRLCSICHTVDGTNGLVELTGSWDAEQMRMNIAKLQQTKPFMPPFAGSPSELEALVQFLRWSADGRPTAWPTSESAAVLTRIRTWLDEAGTESAVARPNSM
jgi:cytochrome bd ubiquinol oxidase subunit I